MLSLLGTEICIGSQTSDGGRPGWSPFEARGCYVRPSHLVDGKAAALAQDRVSSILLADLRPAWGFQMWTRLLASGAEKAPWPAQGLAGSTVISCCAPRCLNFKRSKGTERLVRIAAEEAWLGPFIVSLARIPETELRLFGFLVCFC